MFVLIGLALASAPISISRADSGGRADPSEWNGKNYLDITSINHGHRGAPNVLRHSVRMLDAWEDFDLEDEDSVIVISYNLDDDRRAEASVVIDYDAELGGLYAYMQHHRDGAERVYLEQPSRPDDRTVSVVFGKKYLRPGLEAYRWKVRTWASSENDDDCAEPLHGPPIDEYSVCSDFAPNRRWVIHDV